MHKIFKPVNNTKVIHNMLSTGYTYPHQTESFPHKNTQKMG